METLNKTLTAALESNGASLVGVGDLSEIDPQSRDGFPYGISFAVSLRSEIVLDIVEGPNTPYVDECLRADKLLNNLANIATDILISSGHRVKQQATTNTTGAKYPPNLTTELPHKTVATRAGLGWIGKCALLINEEFGSAIRLGSILTDAELSCNLPVGRSRCKDCNVCASVCPAKAISGEEWHPGIERSVLIDAYACRDKARQQLINRTGGEVPGRTFCGMCIAACPWTKNYLAKTA
jgi:epoxyqueuosine reductase